MDYDEISNKINDNIITIITAPTGSGKTVKVPFRLVTDYNKIFVSIPTKISVKNAYEYLIKDKNILREDKNLIGYAAGAQQEGINYDEDSVLVYATTGHIKNKMLFYLSKRQDIDFCDLLIVDESHDESFDTSLIMFLYNYYLKIREDKPLTRLLLMTATNVDYPFNPIITDRYDIKLDRKYNTDIVYYDKNVSKNQVNDAIIEIFNNYQKKVKGHILIFVAGKSDINYIIKSLQSVVNSNSVLIELHSKSTNVVNNNIGGKRKIFVATNVAETSITIEGVGFVIDSLLHKVNKEPILDGSIKLVTDYISKNNAIQRAGRTGRTMDGICVRVCTEDFYNNLPEYMSKEIDRLPIHRMILDLYSYNLDPYDIIPKQYKDKLDQSVLYLYNLKLLSKKGITKIGKICNLSPFGFKHTLLIINSCDKLRHSMIIIVALMEYISLDLINFKKIKDISETENILEFFIKRWNNNTIKNFMMNTSDFFSDIEKCKSIFNITDKQVNINYNEVKNYLMNKEELLHIVVLDINNNINKSLRELWDINSNRVLVLSSFQINNRNIISLYIELNATKIVKETSYNKFLDKNRIFYGLGNKYDYKIIKDYDRNELYKLLK